MTFLITVFGFGISAFGFWAKLRQTDDLRVLITSSAPLITTETDRIGFTQPISLTYINSGNRQARISNLGLVALKYNDTRTPTDESCDAGEPDTKIYPRFDFASIVIKPGEITDIRDLKYAFGLLSKPRESIVEAKGKLGLSLRDRKTTGQIEVGGAGDSKERLPVDDKIERVPLHLRGAIAAASMKHDKFKLVGHSPTLYAWLRNEAHERRRPPAATSELCGQGDATRQHRAKCTRIPVISAA